MARWTGRTTSSLRGPHGIMPRSYTPSLCRFWWSRRSRSTSTMPYRHTYCRASESMPPSICRCWIELRDYMSSCGQLFSTWLYDAGVAETRILLIMSPPIYRLITLISWSTSSTKNHIIVFSITKSHWRKRSWTRWRVWRRSRHLDTSVNVSLWIDWERDREREIQKARDKYIWADCDR